MSQMKATGLAIHQLEMNSPLSASEEELLNDIFKPQYVPQIHCWALVHTQSRRQKLFNFLTGSQTSKPSRTASSLASPQLQRDFRLNTTNCQINFGFSFNPRPVSRQTHRDRFASPGITGQCIFREETLETRPRQKPSEEETLATFMLRKLMNPQVVSRFRSVANANYRCFTIVINWN
jgi:hypothetical protein